jgi:hypothetical protein
VEYLSVTPPATHRKVCATRAQNCALLALHINDFWVEQTVVGKANSVICG